MPEAPTKTDTKAKRPLDVIQRDLDKAKARHKELHPQVELDNHRGNAVNERNRKRLEAWQKENPGETFDEEIAGFSVAPYQFNEKLQADFHAIHYEIARLEGERKVAIADRAKV